MAGLAHIWLDMRRPVTPEVDMAIGLYGPEYLQFDEGGPAAEVKIFVFLRGTKVKAQLYADKTGFYTGPNPVWTDRRGELVFFATLGLYDLWYDFSNLTIPIEIPAENIVDTGVYVHTQSLAADIWTVPHNLGIKPGVTVEESVTVPDDITYPAIRHLDNNNLELRWGYAASGRVTCRR